MKRLLIALCAVLALASCAPRTTVCVNPPTYSDTPDPDVVRVGDDYYLVTTTMYYCPMVPIMHSRDLVHWRIVSYVTPDLGEDDHYTFKNGKNAYGKGQWATSLQYHDGYFYVLFITNELRKTFIYRTQDAMQSNWEQVLVLDEFYHDASLLFDDDGRVFVVYGNRQLRVVELEPDLSGLREGGLDTLIVDFNPEGFGLCAEGTRFYHIGDWYYLLEIDWPSGGIRTERCWRSRNIEGPYEQKVICDGTLGGRNAGIAQGPMVQTQKGDWYAILFQDHGAVGRLITVQSVTWTDGWPICGDNTRPLETLEVNLPPCGENYLWDNDEFDETELPLVWQWNHKPLDGCWSLTERPGWLRLTTGQLATDITDARNTLTQRTVGPACESIVKLDASGLKPGDYAGISAFQSSRLTIGISVGEDGDHYLTARARAFRKEEQTIACFPTESDVVWLKINYDFNTDIATMSCSYDGESWMTMDYALHMLFTLDYFTGYRTGLFCYATESLGGYADFDFFHQNIVDLP